MQFSMKHCFAVLLNCASPNVRQAHTLARHVYVLAAAPKQLQSYSYRANRLYTMVFYLYQKIRFGSAFRNCFW